jgi:hypothetical protein
MNQERDYAYQGEHLHIRRQVEWFGLDVKGLDADYQSRNRQQNHWTQHQYPPRATDEIETDGTASLGMMTNNPHVSSGIASSFGQESGNLFLGDVIYHRIRRVNNRPATAD